ncbi:hypothetical protein NXS19_002284 [Fusarium pseudograminearum]|nr:hypothetical protein NXS19_002284 [Fusarium pseudograminearum]
MIPHSPIEKQVWAIGACRLFSYHIIQNPSNTQHGLRLKLVLTIDTAPEILTMIFEQAPLVDKVMLATSCFDHEMFMVDQVVHGVGVLTAACFARQDEDGGPMN